MSTIARVPGRLLGAAPSDAGAVPGSDAGAATAAPTVVRTPTPSTTPAAGDSVVAETTNERTQRFQLSRLDRLDAGATPASVRAGGAASSSMSRAGGAASDSNANVARTATTQTTNGLVMPMGTGHRRGPIQNPAAEVQQYRLSTSLAQPFPNYTTLPYGPPVQGGRQARTQPMIMLVRSDEIRIAPEAVGRGFRNNNPGHRAAANAADARTRMGAQDVEFVQGPPALNFPQFGTIQEGVESNRRALRGLLQRLVSQQHAAGQEPTVGQLLNMWAGNRLDSHVDHWPNYREDAEALGLRRDQRLDMSLADEVEAAIFLTESGFDPRTGRFRIEGVEGATIVIRRSDPNAPDWAKELMGVQRGGTAPTAGQPAAPSWWRPNR